MGKRLTTQALALALVSLASGCASNAQSRYESIPPPYGSSAAVPMSTTAYVEAAPGAYPVTYVDSGAAPRPAFEYEGIPPPSASAPAFRSPSQAQEQQRLTAERLAQYQRAQAQGSSVRLPAPPDMVVTRSSPPQLASSPMYGQSGAMVSDAPISHAPTDYYAGDYSGAGAIPPMPTQARPGECFALVRQPEQYRTVSQSYIARPGYDRVEVQPARYQTETQEVVTAEAYERLEVIPATFKTVTEQVEVSPASVRYAATEPVYETVTERVLERPGRQVWKRGRGPIERVDNATGEILCLVEEPPVYTTVTRRVLRQQPQVQEIPIPAQYRTVTRRVIDQPAQVRRVLVPEQRARMSVQRLVEPARMNRVRVPDEMGTYSVRQLAAPAVLEWRPVLCETNMTPDTVRRVQDALRAQGFDPGPSDGRMGAQTLSAMNAFQASRGLPQDRYLNMETVRALGVAY